MSKIYYPMIVSDFDGTLVNEDGTISEKNRKIISEYVDAGGVFAICTGRMPNAILPHARKLGLKGLLCCGQGTVALEIESGEILFENRLSLETTLAACRKMEDIGLHILAFDLWDFYSNKDGALLKLYEGAAKTTGKLVTDRTLSSFLEEQQMSAFKLMALVDPKDNEKVFNELKNANLPGCDITKSADFLVEVVNQTNSKGTALSFLAEHYGVTIENTIAVGDNYNDISMIKRAGMGIAVKNAENALKKQADYICEYTNEESAIASIIEKFGLGKN